MKQPPEYQAGTIRPIVQIAMRIAAQYPDLVLASDHDALWRLVCEKIPDLKDPAKCGGCNRNMKITVYEADLHDALLVLAMGRVVKKNLSEGIPFTEANRVHLPTLQATHATIKRSTKCDYLCFVKQPEDWRGSGYWVLTSWGFDLLRGDPVPRAVKYWEGNLIQRSQKTTTLQQMFNTHRDLVEKALAKRKAVKADHRALFADYRPAEWAGIFPQLPREANKTAPLFALS